jgi:hypothetical protein
MIFHGRRIALGERVLGMYGQATIDPTTVNEWIRAYARTVADIVSR